MPCFQRFISNNAADDWKALVFVHFFMITSEPIRCLRHLLAAQLTDTCACKPTADTN